MAHFDVSDIFSAQLKLARAGTEKQNEGRKKWPNDTPRIAQTRRSQRLVLISSIGAFLSVLSLALYWTRSKRTHLPDAGPIADRESNFSHLDHERESSIKPSRVQNG